MIKKIMAVGDVSEQAARDVLEICNREMVIEPRRIFRQKKVAEVHKVRGDKVPVECYSRVVGYFRPVNQWNKGKQAEFFDRVTYRIPVVANNETT